MSYILTLSGSNSATSINTDFLRFIQSCIKTTETKELDLRTLSIPMYSIDLENSRGIPVDVQIIKNKISESAGLVLSVNEHNGSVSVFFKNILDWLSRADRNFLERKKILLLSTSPGARGASAALEYTKSTLPRFGGVITESFSFPSFYDNFDIATKTIKDPLLEMGIKEVVASYLQQLETDGV